MVRGVSTGVGARWLPEPGCTDARRGDGPLIHAAADGETAGHHNAWGDRVLSDVLARALEREGVQVTNYGAVLDVDESSVRPLDPGEV